MDYLKRLPTGKTEDAVSPVVGVMLMLVVTIIIAAVISGFAGGLMGNAHKSPTLQMDVKISNSGSWYGSGFYANVHGVSEPISTKNIKLVTSWTAYNTTTQTSVTGGNTSIGGVVNSYYYITQKQYIVIPNAVPSGFGVGITNESSAAQDSDPDMLPAQMFGNYTLMQGTSMIAQPEGANGPGISTSEGSLLGGYGVLTPFQYSNDPGSYNGPGSGQIDPMQAVLGTGWENLRAGDTVSVKIVYVPTGQTIFSKDVAVVED
ncbi:type IV pilin N-terminal domain-containing protein [Methanoregula sp.]|uniref:type IV pilin N-terminal domain-containing protein n=1 Tax=Methanoregula sp. TaxID=2052170 RepID=UPI003C72D463